MENRSELAYWLALFHTPGIGPVLFSKLIDEVSDFSQLFESNLPKVVGSLLTPALLAQLKNPNWQAVETDLAWAKRPGHAILTLNDPGYPLQLKRIPSAPPILYVVGQKELLQTLQLAIVGSRNPTATGSETAYHFAYDLAKAGVVITSGLALGIDARAHQGALDAQGFTIAVCGTGLDRVYPEKNKALASKIMARGALISEFPIGVSPIGANFPRRNRIISGLSEGVLVVEAAQKSGSLITARYALEQNKEIFAIPGSIHNPLARGCHQLIRQGATLVERTDELLEEVYAFRHLKTPKDVVEKSTISDTQDTKSHGLLPLIGYEVTPIEVLIERSQLSVAAISAQLVMLEMAGLVCSMPGGYIRGSAQ